MKPSSSYLALRTQIALAEHRKSLSSQLVLSANCGLLNQACDIMSLAHRHSDRRLMQCSCALFCGVCVCVCLFECSMG